MKRVFATINLFTPDQGGRRQSIRPIAGAPFGCPVQFHGVAELLAHAYDCRMLMSEYGRPIAPGETATDVPIVFLSADEVLPYMRPGITFDIWEGKTIGKGEVTRLE